MITDVTQYLTEITIGIRYNPNFSIRDNFGNITDRILYSKKSFFNEEMFPLALVNPRETQLSNDETGDSLQINSTNIILTCNLSNPNIVPPANIQPKLTIDKLNELHKRFEQDILRGIVREFKIGRINRIGYINKYRFNIRRLSVNFIKKTIGHTFSDITNIDLRFSKKYPLPASMVKKDINDYHNVILTISKKADNEDFLIAIDYQHYFDPVLDVPNQLEFSEFLNSSQSYNSSSFTNWLNQHYGERNGKKT